MSDEHKAALAQGRRESRVVKRYLQMIGDRKPGRPVTRESLTKRLETVGAKLATETDPLKKVKLLQQQLDIQAALANQEPEGDSSAQAAETSFIDLAAAYSQRAGIGYAAWRQMGVPAEVLRKAGIARTRSS